MIDFKATLIDGGYHDVDSSVLAFEIAARAAFRELREKGAPKLLEPIMKVEVADPGRIPGRRHRRPELAAAARSRAPRPRGNAQVVTAFVPLANMFGYINNAALILTGPRRSSRCSTTTTNRCRKPSPTK